MEEQIKELTLLLLYLTSWTEKEQSENMIGGSTYKASLHI